MCSNARHTPSFPDFQYRRQRTAIVPPHPTFKTANIKKGKHLFSTLEAYYDVLQEGQYTFKIAELQASVHGHHCGIQAEEERLKG